VLSQLLEVLLLPRRFPGVLRAETGVLLHGPPGTGKTLLVRRLARLAGTQHSHRLLTLRLVDVVRGEVGAGERAIASVFQEAKRVAPAILFIDEFQALFVSRSVTSSSSAGADDKSLSSTLAGCFDDLAEWNAHAGSSSLVTVIAATNEPWAVDEGFLRPGRFDRVLFVGPLSEVDRAAFLQQAGVEIVDKVLLDKTAGFSGADMELLAIRAQKLQIGVRTTAEAFLQSCAEVSPTSTPAEIREYESWQVRHS
jgi:SpoVK/Ycf46/Vps4 family AAA+-type ATPase